MLVIRLSAGTAAAPALARSGALTDARLPRASAEALGIWDAATYALRRSIAHPGLSAQVVEFACHGDRLAAVTGGRSARIFDLNARKQLAELNAPDEVLCIAVCPDGSRIATGGRDQVIRIWDATTYDEVVQLRGHESYVKSLVFGSDGELLVSGSGDGTVRLWDARGLGGL